MKKKFIYLSLMVLSGIVPITSCSTNKAVGPTSPTTTNSVSIQNFAFIPDTVIIKTGASVKWTNMDSSPHTVTELSSAFDSGSLSTTQTFNYKFSNTGTFTYHCLIHSMMKSAVVIVTN